MLLKIKILFFIIITLVFTTVNAAEEGSAASINWQEFKSGEGRFSIEFPSKPTIKTTHKISVIGDVTNHIFVSKTDDLNFGVDYSDLPGFAITFSGKNTIYSHTTGALLKKTLGKLKSNEDFQYQGHSGKHLVYDIPPVPDKPLMYGEAYIFLIDKRLYVIDANAPAETSVNQVQRFLNSVRFE